MNNQQEFYTKKKAEAESQRFELKKKASTLAWARGILFVVGAAGVYSFWSLLSTYWPILILLVGVFLWLVKKYQEVKKNISFIDNIIEINQTEIDIYNGQTESRKKGSEYLNPDHAFSNDIDLFGEGSFFQFINRTTTLKGERLLVENLTKNDIHNIEDKQEEIKELAEKSEFRQRFTAQSMMVELKSNSSKLLTWFDEQSKRNPSSKKWLVFSFSLISIALILLSYFQFIDSNIVMYWFFIGLGITAFRLKVTNGIAANAEKYTDMVSQYSSLIENIEEEDFKSKRLIQIKNNIRTEDLKASVILKDLEKIINGLNNRRSILISVLLNGFFLYDYYFVDKFDQWIANYTDNLRSWFDSIYHIDSVNSLAGYAFNHPKYIFPKLTKSGSIINATELGHPQISEAKRVNNDITIDEKQFIIITGANMAGKSTFLRTISLHIALANSGLPAAAKSFNYKPIKLISSMRTSDSLKDQESYFFSELKRLKYIIDTIQSEDHFVVLDEILKGTNSKDKEEGSKKFVKKLTESGATGIIATHDLSLCELSQEHDQVSNKYFDAEIKDDELFFDYKFKDGVCHNMNASFLLRKMEIV